MVGARISRVALCVSEIEGAQFRRAAHRAPYGGQCRAALHKVSRCVDDGEKRVFRLRGAGSLRARDALRQDRAQFIEHALDQGADKGGGARKIVIDGGDRQIGAARDLAHLEPVRADLA